MDSGELCDFVPKPKVPSERAQAIADAIVLACESEGLVPNNVRMNVFGDHTCIEIWFFRENMCLSVSCDEEGQVFLALSDKNFMFPSGKGMRSSANGVDECARSVVRDIMEILGGWEREQLVRGLKEKIV